MKWLTLAATAALVVGLFAAAHSAPLPPFPPENVGLLPGLKQVDVVRLQRKLVPLARQCVQVSEQMQEAKDDATRRDLAVQLEKACAQYDDVARQNLSDANYQKVRSLPTGPGAEYRFAHQQLMALPGMGEPIRGHLAALIAAVEKKESPQAEKRLWRLAGLLLTPEQMRAVKAQLPAGLQAAVDPQNYLMLPGFTAAQANRVRALFAGLESEMAGVGGEAKDLEKRGNDPQAQDRMMALQERLMARFSALQEDLDKILTPEQRSDLAALPPYTLYPEMGQSLKDLMEGLALEASQASQAHQWVQPLMERAQAAEPQMKEAAKQAEGADAAQQMGAMMEVRKLQQPLEAEQIAVARRIAGLLTDAQMASWVLR